MIRYFVFYLMIFGIVLIPVYAIDELNLRTAENSKIHSVLLKWISSESPDQYALENNLSIKNGKIHVYIYLQNSSEMSKIMYEIDVFASYDNIAEAYVNKEQLYQLDNLEYVSKITPPILVKTPPIPKPEQETNQIENQNFLYLIGISGIVSLVVYFVYKRKKTQ